MLSEIDNLFSEAGTSVDILNTGTAQPTLYILANPLQQLLEKIQNKHDRLKDQMVEKIDRLWQLLEKLLLIME
ncbi:hypothetical protein EI94DRAFT_1726105 [Lactarius quietus]|nr:hypothetical protein EI94DRAFT_1726105 [Lactarius quietus]